MTSTKFLIRLFLFISVFAILSAKAQVVPSAEARELTINAGGFGSLFAPDYPPSNLYGVGTYVDIRFRKWVQVEGEARWLIFNKYGGAYQVNYGVGPRVPIYRFGKIQTYGKFLFTDTKINFAGNLGYGHFLDYTMGGGAEIRLSRKLTLRAVDFEYHYLPNYFGTNLQPYGVSAGLAYRVF